MKSWNREVKRDKSNRPLMKYLRGFLIPVLFWSLSAILIFPETISELEQKLNQAHGLEKTVFLNKLSELLWQDNTTDKKEKEKALEYAQRALEYAKTFKQADQEVLALANIGYACIRLKYYDRALENAKKSLELAEKRKNKKEILRALDALGMTYTEVPDYQKALPLFKRMRVIYAEIGDKKGEALSLNRIGNIYMISGENEKVLEQRKEALRLYQDVDDHDGIVRSMEYIGAFYRRSGNNREALEYYLKGLKLAEQKGLAYSAGRICYILAKFYKNLKQYQKSLHYLYKAADRFKESNRTEWLKDTYTQLGSLLVEQKDYNRALSALNQALKIQSQQRDSVYNILEPILLKIGQIYFEKKEYQKAIAKYEEALASFKKIKDEDINRLAFCYKHIGEVHLAKNDLKTAYKNLNKSRELSEKSGDISLLKDNYKLLSDYCEKKGNYPKALEYHRLYADLNLKIYNEESAKAITEMQTKYETEKKEKEIELLMKKEQIQELTLSKQRIVRNVSIAGFVLILIIMAYFVKKYHYLLSFWKRKHYIGRYRVVDKIGSGGMGVVYKAHDVQDKTKTLAIKLIREEYFDDEIHRKRFKHEALVTDQLDHPNIVKIFERGESGSNLYIAMELLHGKGLETKLQEEGQLNLKECLYIMIQVSDALVLIHSKNIIHRDLKPSNIMLIEKDGDKNFVKLLDFGVARAEFQTRLTRTGIMVGTTSYLSPEQITNSGVTTASDIFSLGIIFYEMVCGRKPFPGESESDIIRAILDTTPTAPKKLRAGIPEKLNELINKMLEKDKEPRPTSKETLATLKAIKKNL